MGAVWLGTAKLFSGMRMKKWISITGPLVVRVCVVRREKQLSVVTTPLVLFSAVNIRKILTILRGRCSVLLAVYGFASLRSVIYCA